MLCSAIARRVGHLDTSTGRHKFSWPFDQILGVSKPQQIGQIGREISGRDVGSTAALFEEDAHQWSNPASTKHLKPRASCGVPQM